LLTYFEARDLFDQQVLNQGSQRVSAELSIFRFLLSHTFWDASDRYGQVNYDVCPQTEIAKLTGLSKVTVSRVLAVLEDAAMIRREHRSAGRGSGRKPDQITVTWLLESI
jgi:DNA-binding MarR family transcriptional regulator